MTRLELTIGEPYFEGRNPRDKYDLELGVSGQFDLLVDGRRIFSEPDFTIVELRRALVDWLPPADTDFVFISIEAEDEGLLWFRRQPSGRWLAGSVWQQDVAHEELDAAEVLQACRAFVAAVERWVRENLGVDVDEVLNQPMTAPRRSRWWGWGAGRA